MSVYPTDQRCPRCQYPVVPGATTCANCGLALQSLPGAYPNSPSGYSPPASPASGGSYGTIPSPDPYGSGGAGAYGSGGQSATYYNPQGTISNAPTVGSSLYPQTSGNYPGSQPQGSYGTGPGGYQSSQPQGSFPPPPPPPTYPTSQPQGGYGTTAGSYPGSQMDGGFGAPPTFTTNQPPGVFGAPPGVAAPPQPKGRGPMIAILAIVVVVILGGGGAAAYFLTRPKATPQPVITFDKTAPGSYAVGQTPAGAIGTTFCVSGTKFAANSTVTFLLDGQPAPDTGTAQTDTDGTLTNNKGSNPCQNSKDFDLTVTSKWGMNNHTLTAKDASGNVTQSGITVDIVAQGEAKTPGPNGAPYDSQTFSISVTINARDATDNSSLGSFDETLNITGQPDPQGGKVCQSRDDGTEQDLNGTVSYSDGTTQDYVEKVHYSCEGTYKGGMLTYTETALNAEFDFKTSSGTVACLANQYVEEKMTGSFGTDGTFSGSYSSDEITLNCPSGTVNFDASTGDWTGNVGTNS